MLTLFLIPIMLFGYIAVTSDNRWRIVVSVIMVWIIVIAAAIYVLTT